MEVDKNISKILLDEIQYFQEYIRNNLQKINETNSWGLTYLMVACQLGNTDFINFLLESGASLEVSDQAGDTALHYAVFGHQCDVVALMVSKGANINSQDKSGNTALHYAVGKNYEDVMEIILNTKASQSDVAVDIKNCNKMTPLLQAVSGGHFGMIQKLLSHGADINAVDNNDNNCLHLAVKKGMFHSEGEALGILDEFCTKLELSLENKLAGYVVAEYLAYHGANFYHENKRKQTPLDLIEDSRIREKMQTFFPPPLPCKWCEENKPTITFHPCGHTVICEECCSKIRLKSCPECSMCITGKCGVDGSPFDAESISTCTICMERRWNMVFQCGHTTCKECGDQINRCHLCRKTIETKIIVRQ